jgi:hypothetical protein
LNKEESQALVKLEPDYVDGEIILAWHERLALHAEKKRRQLSESLEQGRVADPISGAFLTSLLVSAAVSVASMGVSYLINRALRPSPKPLQQGQMSGYLTVQTQIGALWNVVLGGDPGDGYGGAWVAPIVVSESKIAKVVQVSRQEVGGGKGPGRQTQEVDTTLYYFPYIALGFRNWRTPTFFMISTASGAPTRANRRPLTRARHSLWPILTTRTRTPTRQAERK